MDTNFCLIYGNDFPYDAPNSWKECEDEGVYKFEKERNTWEYKAARAIVYNLRDRHSIKHGFSNIDEATRIEIIDSIANIIKLAEIS